MALPGVDGINVVMEEADDAVLELALVPKSAGKSTEEMPDCGSSVVADRVATASASVELSGADLALMS